MNSTQHMQLSFIIGNNLAGYDKENLGLQMSISQSRWIPVDSIWTQTKYKCSKVIMWLKNVLIVIIYMYNVTFTLKKAYHPFQIYCGLEQDLLNLRVAIFRCNREDKRSNGGTQ